MDFDNSLLAAVNEVRGGLEPPSIPWELNFNFNYLLSIYIFRSLNYILERAVTFFPQSVVIALLSPFFFFILNRFWNDDPKGSLGAGI